MTATKVCFLCLFAEENLSISIFFLFFFFKTAHASPAAFQSPSAPNFKALAVAVNKKQSVSRSRSHIDIVGTCIVLAIQAANSDDVTRRSQHSNIVASCLFVVYTLPNRSLYVTLIICFYNRANSGEGEPAAKVHYSMCCRFVFQISQRVLFTATTTVMHHSSFNCRYCFEKERKRKRRKSF